MDRQAEHGQDEHGGPGRDPLLAASNPALDPGRERLGVCEDRLIGQPGARCRRPGPSEWSSAMRSECHCLQADRLERDGHAGIDLTRPGKLRRATLGRMIDGSRPSKGGFPVNTQ